MNDNEYRKFEKDGYNARDLDVDVSKISSINISEEPIGITTKGRERYDKGVTISDGNVTKKTSSILTGYTKLRLKNGSYISEKELLECLRTELSINRANEFVISKKTGKKVNPDIIGNEVVRVVKNSGALQLEDSNTISNQETKKVSVREIGEKESQSKGIFMLGNGQIKMPNGEYISLKEVQEAIANYVILAPKKTPPIIVDPVIIEDDLIPKMPQPPEPTPEEIINTDNELEKEKEVHKVVRRLSAKFRPWAAGISAAMILALGIGMKTGNDKLSMPSIENNLEYSISSINETDIVENYEQVLNRIYNEVEIGQLVSVEPGVKYYRSSDYNENTIHGVFGENKIRPAGDYNVDYISVLKEGRIVKVEVGKGQTVLNTLQNVADRFNSDITELEPVIHLGGPVSGWVKLSDLLTEEQLTPQKIETKITLDKEYTGNVENFSGGKIKIQTENGIVELPVMDQDGNLLTDGTTVLGSDGQEYRISSLNMDQEEIIGEETKDDEMHLQYSLHNIVDEHALAAAIIAASAPLMTLLTAKKKETEEEITDEEYKELLETYKEKFDKNSSFVKAINRVNSREPDWERINISLTGVEAISELYTKEGSGIKKW